MQKSFERKFLNEMKKLETQTDGELKVIETIDPKHIELPNVICWWENTGVASTTEKRWLILCGDKIPQQSKIKSTFDTIFEGLCYLTYQRMVFDRSLWIDSSATASENPVPSPFILTVSFGDGTRKKFTNPSFQVLYHIYESVK